MDVIDSLNTKIWQSAQAEDFPAFAEYTVIRHRMLKPGQFEVACKQLTEEGDIPHIMAKLEGTCGKMNPLSSVRNCELILRDRNIVGINVAGDCAVMNDVQSQ